MSAAGVPRGYLRRDVLAWAQGMKEEDLQSLHDDLATLYDQLKTPTSAIAQLKQSLYFSYECFDWDSASPTGGAALSPARLSATRSSLSPPFPPALPARLQPRKPTRACRPWSCCRRTR